MNFLRLRSRAATRAVGVFNFDQTLREASRALGEAQEQYEQRREQDRQVFNEEQRKGEFSLELSRTRVGQRGIQNRDP